MDVTNAAGVLAGSILTGLALIVIVATIVAINNIFHRYWKPVTLWRCDSLPARFADPTELKETNAKQI
jgi:hypothetical protein